MILANIIVALGLVVSRPTPAPPQLPADSIMAELKKGGYTLLWRHTDTDKSGVAGDDRAYAKAERFQQRNLSDKGVADARAIGALLMQQGIPIGDILMSPMFACVPAELSVEEPDRSVLLQAAVYAETGN